MVKKSEKISQVNPTPANVARKTKKPIKKAVAKTKKKAPSKAPPIIDPKLLESAAYIDAMERINKKLPRYQKWFSRLVHSQSIDIISNLLGRSIFRPSAIIGAGSLAAIGMLAIWLNASNLGHQISDGVFGILIIVGWVMGLVVDLAFQVGRELSKG